MLYTKPYEWTNSKSKRVLLFGMSGLGKTYISNLLREDGDWFHYSIDYRIGTRYMGEFISDSYKLAAMKTPCLLYTSPSPRDKRQSRMPSSA